MISIKGLKKFPHYKQLDFMDCGAACLKIISRFHGKYFNIDTLRSLCNITKSGTSFRKLSVAAEKVGFKTYGAKVDIKTLQNDIELPCIAHWNQNHFIVIYKITATDVYVSDPASSLIRYSVTEFLKGWSDQNGNGAVLILETTRVFFTQEDEDNLTVNGLQHVLPLFKKYTKYVKHILVSLLAVGFIQLSFPFLTQYLIDYGVNFKRLDIIYLILIAQLFLFIGKTSIDIIRSWFIVHISSRINISMISVFFVKLMNLPLSFFDRKMNGDILQRLNDHKRVEQIITSNSINILLSSFNLLLFGAVLCYYNIYIFLIFLVSSIVSFFWIYFFIKRRKTIDYKRFTLSSIYQSKTIELINGMQEIKLNNAEKEKRWEWEKNQVKLFKNNIKGLTLDQIQGIGASFINEIKNILITIIAAKLVIKGEISVGMMMSISYIIGQLNGPINQLVGFVQSFQDAKISLERIAEIHNKEEEDNPRKKNEINYDTGIEITLQDVSFSYSGSIENSVLNNISLSIPANKVTAIVGASGSGKTTLSKILLGFYQPTHGSISINNVKLSTIKDNIWRALCGTVLQEGFIFSDTIERNIIIGSDIIDQNKLQNAIKMANISEMIESLPLGLDTQIGAEGMGLSSGQKQRLLIARAIYKDPQVLFFDEATSALDSKNEKEIVQNLDKFFNGRTVVIVAHRLSTIQYADQIVVLDEGVVKEIGSHNQLVANQSYYYRLVQNQMELERREICL